MTEEVYGDVLFIINFSMDFLSLYLAGKIMHFRMSAWRVILGASLGAPYGVCSLLFDLGAFFNHLITLLVMLLMCAVSFRYGSVRSFAATGALFCGISMLIGGIMTAAFTALGKYQTYIEIGGSIHTIYGDLPLWLFAVLAALSALLTWGIGRLIRRKRGMRSCELKIGFGEADTDFVCLVDSGNLLSEPVSGTPVVFVKSEYARFLPDDILLAMTDGVASLDIKTVGRLRLIPAGTVSGERLVIAAVPDRCYLRCGGEYEPKKALVAVDFTGGDFGGFPALVPEELLS